MRTRRRRRASAGYTLVELVVAGGLSLIVVLALGQLVVANQRAWAEGRDKAVLQQNATEALERIARAVRAANRVVRVSGSEMRTYDASGVLLHTYRRVAAGAAGRLQEDGADLVARNCTRFIVTASGDKSVRLDLELEDAAANRVAVITRAAVRSRTLAF